MNAQTAKITPLPMTVNDAIAIFDRSAERTRENHQTAAWKILRSEIERLREYEHVAGILAIEKAELRKLADQRAELLAVCKQIFKEAKNIESDGYMDDDARPVYEALRAAIAKATGEQP